MMVKTNDKKHELTNIELFEENGQYYLKLKYILEDDFKKEEVEIPKARLPFNKNIFPELTINTGRGGPFDPDYTEALVHTGYGNSIKLQRGEIPDTPGEVFYVVRTIEKKHKEMTVAEIEKELGYKIKIIADKKEKKR